MNTKERTDMAWNALVETANNVAPEIPEEFLKKIYEIQKKYQFSEGNNESLQLMGKVIDELAGERK